MEITFKAVYPRALFNIFVMVLLEGSLLFKMIFQRNQSLTYLGVLVMLLILAYLIAMLIRLCSTNLSITLGADYVISSNHKKYEASQIMCIYKNYRRIGFKVYGKRLVPMDLYFYFDSNQETKGLKKLYEWAERNEIEVKNKFFRTLI